MVKVAVLGFGTVGSGVAEVLTRNSAHIEEKAHRGIELKYILDVRDFPDSPFADKIVHDFALIEGDPEVKVVVKTIGGAKIAKEFTERALRAGKSVVTSNKELVASCGYDLMQLAKEHGASYLFEASVGGGIPIIRPLSQCLAANELTEICGILNGTTNYILTRMIRAGLSFEAALKEAQENGFAEKDPTADIEGQDACRKICILGSLAFGRHIYPDQVPTEGISGVSLADAAYAEACGRKIKLLGRAIKCPDGKVMAFVAPHLVEGSAPLASVEGVFNAIAVKGDAIGDVMFYGPGAGKLPTASAVVADVMDVVRHMDSRKYLSWGPGGEDVTASPEALESAWYVRAEAGTDAIRAALGEVSFLARAGAPAGECAFLTAPMTRRALEEKLSGVKKGSLLRLLD